MRRPLVFLHGWACGPEDFTAQVEAFGASREVLAPAWDVDPGAADWGRMLDRLAARVPRGAVLVAHSLGGYPAVGLAARPALGVAALVLLDVTLPLPPERRARYEATIGPLLAPGDPAAVQRGMLDWMRPIFRGYFAEGEDPRVRDEVVGRLESIDLARALATIAAALEAPAEEALRALCMPIRAIFPEHPRADVDLFRAARPDARIEWIPGAGHFLHRTAAGAVNACLAAVLEDV